MAGIGFVNRQDLQHRTIVFPQVTLDLRGRSSRLGGGLTAYSLEPLDIQGRRRVQIRDRVAAEKLGHLDDPAPVRLDQPHDAMCRR